MQQNPPRGERGGHGGCALGAALLITGSVLTAATASASPSTGDEPGAAVWTEPTIAVEAVEAVGAFAAPAPTAAPPAPVAPASPGEPATAIGAPAPESASDPGASPDDATPSGAGATVDSDTEWSVVESTVAVAQPSAVSASSESTSTVTSHTDAAGGNEVASVHTDSRSSQRTVTETQPRVERSESKVTVHVSETSTEHTAG
ncbi:MAG: hypothetical protein KatS3mg010_1411 [Acidimicrobiia bacterium]|nr:MAG: hypothetical protein KatS3mg010_1411 [Acidimicrobiia bacterium]